jgi:hypothetical protein
MLQRFSFSIPNLLTLFCGQRVGKKQRDMARRRYSVSGIRKNRSLSQSGHFSGLPVPGGSSHLCPHPAHWKMRGPLIIRKFPPSTLIALPRIKASATVFLAR